MRKISAGLLIALVSVALGSAYLGVLRINSNLKAIRQQVNTEGDIPLERLRLQGLGSAHDPGIGGPGFAVLSPLNQYATATTFAGKLYLAGPSGLAIYDQPGDPPKFLRTGADLPPAPIVALAVCRFRGEAFSSLVAATQGEGLLVFPNGSLEAIQLRSKEAAARDVTALLPLASGDLLMGTRRAGLLLYNGKTLRTFPTDFTQPSLAADSVTALAGDEGDFWVGTRSHGVLHWRAGQWSAFDERSGLPDAQVEDIATGKEEIFVGTPLGVAQFNDGHLSRVLARGVFAHALALDGHTLMVATIDQGLREVSLKARMSSRAILANEDLFVTHFFTADHNLFAVTASSLLRHEDGGTWHKVISSSPSHQLADSNISSLTFAPDGCLWIGYFDHGVDVFDLQTGRAEHIEDDHVFCINRIIADPQRHTMDIATANGLVLVDSGKSTPRVRQVLSRSDGLISDQVTDVAFTSSGMMVATPAGLTLFTPAGAQSIYAFHGLANNHVYVLAAQPDSSRILAGTLGGISILDGESVRQNVTLRNSGLKRNWITALARVPQPDQPDTWFIGSYGGGVMQMDAAGRVTPIDSPAPTAVINPNAMLLTPQRVFAGSLADGLLVYNRRSRRWSQITAGLPSLNVTAMAEDRGELYVGTDNGIVHIAEARLP